MKLNIGGSRQAIITNTADAVTLNLLIEEFLGAQEFRSPITQRCYRNDLRLFSEWCGSQAECPPSCVMFSDVSRSSIEAFRDQSLQSQGRATVGRRLAAIKAFTKFVRSRYAADDRADGVRRLPVIRRGFKGLTNEQRLRFIAALENEHPRTRFLGHLLLNTGYRISSARAITYANIAPDWSAFQDVWTKGNKRITTPINSALYREMVRYQDWRSAWPTEAPFPLLLSTYRAKVSQPESFKLSTKRMYEQMRDVMLAAKIPAELAHPHSIRHTFAHRFLDLARHSAGQDRALIQTRDALGHSSITVTEWYLASDLQTIRNVMEEM